ncbi:MAG: type IV pilin protein [Thermoleophilia bacterium]
MNKRNISNSCSCSAQTKAKAEAGFTLVELMVVVIIVAILAAIALPMYFSQREKGWQAIAKSDLHNASIVERSYYSDNKEYANDLADLESYGFRKSSNITFDFVTGDPSKFCLEVHYNSGGGQFFINSVNGEPREGGC